MLVLFRGIYSTLFTEPVMLRGKHSAKGKRGEKEKKKRKKSKNVWLHGKRIKGEVLNGKKEERRGTRKNKGNKRIVWNNQILGTYRDKNQ